MFATFQTIRNVWASPLNRYGRFSAVLRASIWHIWKKTAHRPFVKTIFNDIRFVFYPDAVLANMLMLWGESFFYYPFTFMERFLKPGDHFLDVGSNVGLYSLFASRRTGNGLIVCVEPGTTQLERLRKHLEMNQVKAEVFPYAVSNEEKRLTFSREDAVSCVIPGPAGHQEGTYEFVDAKRLDSFVPIRQYHLLKLDVEGFELPALEGASNLMAEGMLPVIMFELNGASDRYDISGSSLTAFLREKGYSLGMYDPEANCLDTTAELGEDVIAATKEGLAMIHERIPGIRII